MPAHIRCEAVGHLRHRQQRPLRRHAMRTVTPDSHPGTHGDLIRYADHWLGVAGDRSIEHILLPPQLQGSIRTAPRALVNRTDIPAGTEPALPRPVEQHHLHSRIVEPPANADPKSRIMVRVNAFMAAGRFNVRWPTRPWRRARTCGASASGALVMTAAAPSRPSPGTSIYSAGEIFPSPSTSQSPWCTRNANAASLRLSYQSCLRPLRSRTWASFVFSLSTSADSTASEYCGVTVVRLPASSKYTPGPSQTRTLRGQCPAG